MSRTSFGTFELSLVDRFGTWLSLRAIRNAIRNHFDLDILEIGCGYNAINLLGVQDHAIKLVGCDFNIAPDVKKLKQFEAIEQPAITAFKLLKGRLFNVIMLISVLEHFPDPLAILFTSSQMLAPGGKLLINVPTWRGKYFLELTAFRLGLSKNGKVEMNDHKMYYDKRDLWPLIVKAGFMPNNIHLSYYKFGLNLFAVITK